MFLKLSAMVEWEEWREEGLPGEYDRELIADEGS